MAQGARTYRLVVRLAPFWHTARAVRKARDRAILEQLVVLGLPHAHLVARPPQRVRDLVRQHLHERAGDPAHAEAAVAAQRGPPPGVLLADDVEQLLRAEREVVWVV